MSRLANITLVQLEYLVALDKYRHFIQAAEASFVTQPTLSMQIKKLEETLNVQLFDRTRHPIEPTDIGREIIEQAKEIINETRRLDDILLKYKDTVAGELKIGIIPTIAPFIMPTFIHKVSEQYPELTLIVKELMTDEIIRDIENNDLDVGVLATPLEINGIIEKPIFYEKFCAYLNPKHVLFSLKSVPIEGLLEDRLWLLSEGNCFRTQTINLCSTNAQKDTGVSLSYESGSLDTLMKIVNLEGGSTIIPQLASLELPSDYKANMRPLEQDDMVREVSLIHRSNYSKQKLTDTVMELIKSCVPEILDLNKDKKVVPIH